MSNKYDLLFLGQKEVLCHGYTLKSPANIGSATVVVRVPAYLRSCFCWLI